MPGPAGGGGLLHTNFNLQSVLPNQPPPTSEALANMYNPNKGLLGGVGILRAALTGSGDVSLYIRTHTHTHILRINTK